MARAGFGQPQSGAFQMAYVVEDVQAAMRTWTDELSVGPWFVLPRFAGIEPRYRGRPTEAEVTLALGFAGHMCIELIQLDDDRPSVWREHVERHGYGFHHFGVTTVDFEADLERHIEQGHELVFEAKVPTGGRAAYVATTAVLPGYVELVNLDAVTDAFFTRLYAASLGWDGGDPIRSFADSS